MVCPVLSAALPNVASVSPAATAATAAAAHGNGVPSAKSKLCVSTTPWNRGCSMVRLAHAGFAGTHQDGGGECANRHAAGVSPLWPRCRNAADRERVDLRCGKAASISADGGSEPRWQC